METTFQNKKPDNDHNNNDIASSVEKAAGPALPTSKVDQSIEKNGRSLASSSVETETKPKATVPAPRPVGKAKASTEENNVTTPEKTRKLPGQNAAHDKKEQVKRLEEEVRKVVLWQNPLRSGAYFILIMAGLILSKAYSLIQIVSALLTVVIGINLVYVNVTIQTQRILADRPGINPYSSFLQNEEITTMDRNFLQRSTELVADVVEALLLRLSRIVLIEDNKTSAKWLATFYLAWKLSAIISVRVLATLMTLLAFSIPPLYTYNKSFIDARLLHGQAICQTHLEQGQQKLQNHWNSICSRFQLSQPQATAASSRKED